MTAVVGDEQTPALPDLERDACAQLRQQEIAGFRQPGRDPAVHPDACDRVMFVRSGCADSGREHRNESFRQARKKPPRYYREGSVCFNCFDQVRSKRSAFITLVHALTKSFANFSLASALP